MKKVFAFAAIAFILCSCVRRSTYTGAMRDIELLEDEVSSLKTENEELEWQVEELEERIEELEDIIERAQSSVEEADYYYLVKQPFLASMSVSDALMILNEL